MVQVATTVERLFSHTSFQLAAISYSITFATFARVSPCEHACRAITSHAPSNGGGVSANDTKINPSHVFIRTHRDDVLNLLHAFLLSSEACSKSYFSSKHAIEIGSLFFWQTVLFSNQGFPILARI
jgi:hypothetical protein